MERRKVLKLLGATSAAAALSACGSSIPARPGSGGIPAQSVRLGAANQILTQFPVIGSFKRYRSNPQGDEDIFVMRVAYMPRTDFNQAEGLTVGEKVLLVARTLVCSCCNQVITNQPIHPQCACSYAEAQSQICAQSGCRVYAQGLEAELHCQSCDSTFNPESGQPMWGQAAMPLVALPLEQAGNELYILV